MRVCVTEDHRRISVFYRYGLEYPYLSFYTVWNITFVLRASGPERVDKNIRNCFSFVLFFYKLNCDCPTWTKTHKSSWRFDKNILLAPLSVRFNLLSIGIGVGPSLCSSETIIIIRKRRNRRKMSRSAVELYKSDQFCNFKMSWSKFPQNMLRTLRAFICMLEFNSNDIASMHE